MAHGRGLAQAVDLDLDLNVVVVVCVFVDYGRIGAVTTENTWRGLVLEIVVGVQEHASDHDHVYVYDNVRVHV